MPIKFLVIILQLQSYINPGLTLDKIIPKTCEADYSEGSVTKPCGLCKLCRHSWSEGATSVAVCTRFNPPPAFQISVYEGRQEGHCEARRICGDKSIRCANKVKCHNMFASYKCGCNDGSYGQLCQYVIPGDLSTDSFADLQNIFYTTYTYSTDFVVFYLYFYNTGLNFSVEVSTYREDLTYDADVCRTNVMPVESLCKQYLESAEVSSPKYICTPYPTYVTNINKRICAISVSLMFPRVQPQPDNEKDFLFENPSYYEQEKTIVAKAETVEITVRNKISSLGENSTISFSQFGLRVIYLAKNPLEKCSPLVKIPKFSLTSRNVSRFGRSEEISISSSVVSEDTPLCEQFGEPVITWFVWIVDKNHDERSDEPFKIIEHNTLDFPSFSLNYGLYKVRNEVRLQTNYFSTEIAYCYFKIVELPLSLVIVGGDLRYIYYKDDIELVVQHGGNPNYPLNRQPILKYTWSCDDTTDPVCQEVKTAGSRSIPGPFQPNKTYNFRLKFKEPHSRLVEASQLIIVSPDPIPNLYIHCLKNCGGKNFRSDPREIVHFLVSKSPYANEWRTDESPYEWTCTAGERAVDIKVETIRQQESTPSWVFIVERNTLVSDRMYVFKVRDGAEMAGEAHFSIRMFEPAGGVNCNVSPKVGVSGETKFTVECHLEQYENYENSSLTFLFYDKYSDDQNGRLVCSSFAGTVENLILTRGTVFVQVMDRYVKYTDGFVKVNLTPPVTEQDFLNRFLQILDTLSLSEGYDQKISFISALSDILDNEPDKKKDIAIKLLEILSKETPSNLIHLELLLSTTQSVICNKGDCSQPMVDPYETLTSLAVYEYLLKILTLIANNLAKKLTRNNFYLTYSKISFLYSLLIKCAGVLLVTKDTALINLSISNIDYNVYKLYKYGNLKMLKRLGDVDRAIAINNLPYMNTTISNTDFFKTWLKEDTPFYFVGGRSDESGVRFSPELAQSVGKLASSVVVQTTVFKEDPYWWSQVDHVNTELISVSVGCVDRSGVQQSYYSYKEVTSLNNSIDVFVTKKLIENETVSGWAVFVDPLGDGDERDMNITVHRIFPAVGATILVRFVGLSEGSNFIVLIIEDLRPSYELMQSEGVNITYDSPEYNFTNCCRDKENNDCTAYMGILFGRNDGTASNYTFELQTVRCQTWYDVLWTTSHCTVGTESSDQYLHCQCSHLSTIAGFFQVPINTFDPFSDYELVLTIPDNPYIAALVLTVLFIYFLVFTWSLRKDKDDLKKTTLITLEDNITSDTFGFIVVVCTGTRLCAGTSSTIGLTLHGTITPSRSHILRSSQRATLQRSSEDWFLLFTPNHLGKISSIQLWTSHSGPGPNWFCDRIYVRDLHSKTNYTFVIGKWFGVTLLGLRSESFFRPAKLDEDFYFGSYLMTNTINLFRESHGYLSVVTCHPRSSMSRPQRLTILLVRLLMTFLMSLVFFKAGSPPEDESTYRVTVKHVVIAIYSLTAAMWITITAVIAFRKSQVVKKSFKNKFDEEVLLEEVIVDNTKGFIEKLKIGKRSCLGWLIYYFSRCLLLLRRRNYCPVQSNRDTRFLIVHKYKRIFAWVYSTLIISVVSCFIVLYGLKLGRVKSLEWLTIIGMSSGGHAFLFDPIKIFVISSLFGILRTELCDRYAYDAKELQKKITIARNLEQDCILLDRRVKQKEYRSISGIKMLKLRNNRRKIQKWWSFIDILDILISTIIIFAIVAAFIVEYNNNEMFRKDLFKEVASEGTYRPSATISNKESYWHYLVDSVIPDLFITHWYNRWPLTEEAEILPETVWAVGLTHRLLGVPRLRQIRVRNEPCLEPRLFSNLSLFSCKVKYSGDTEDMADHGTQWKGSEYDDVMFSQSPWIYHPPEWKKSLSVFGESGVSFHGGGYWAVLHSSQRYTTDTISSLEDTDWLDKLTRVIFFEASTYNVNVHAFTVIIFVTEFMESSLVLSGKRVMSIFIRRETLLLEAAYFFCAVLTFVKLLMLLSISGPRSFFTSFWCVYDFILSITGMCCLVSYRLYLQLVSHMIFKFIEQGGNDFFQYQRLASQVWPLRNLISLILVFTLVRSLRLLIYVNLEEWKKQTNTLYFTWPKIQWSTLVVVVLMYNLQRLVSYLVGTLYPLELSHLIPFRFSYLSLLNSAVSPESKFFTFAPCFLSNIFMGVYILIIIKGFSIHNF